MIREPKPENLAKLNEDQRKVFDAWQKEAAQADVIMQALLDALAKHDSDEVTRLVTELEALIPKVCEHGRSVYSDCMACDEIEKIVFPEDYDSTGNKIFGLSAPTIDKSLN